VPPKRRITRQTSEKDRDGGVRSCSSLSAPPRFLSFFSLFFLLFSFFFFLSLSLSLFFFSFFSFFLNKRRFCYRSGPGVRQRNRMSARAGCDVRAAGQAGKYRKPARLLATQTLSSLCVPLFSPLPLPRSPPASANSPSSSSVLILSARVVSRHPLPPPPRLARDPIF